MKRFQVKKAVISTIFLSYMPANTTVNQTINGIKITDETLRKSHFFVGLII